MNISDVQILFAMLEGALQDVGANSRGHIAARAIEILTGGVTSHRRPAVPEGSSLLSHQHR